MLWAQLEPADRHGGTLTAESWTERTGLDAKLGERDDRLAGDPA